MPSPVLRRDSGVRKTFLFFNYLLIHLSIYQDGTIDSSFCHWVTIYSCLYLFWPSTCPSFCPWEPLRSASSILLSQLYIFFEHFCTFWQSKRPTRTFPAQLWNWSFLQGALMPSGRRMVFRKEDLDDR